MRLYDEPLYDGPLYDEAGPHKFRPGHLQGIGNLPQPVFGRFPWPKIKPFQKLMNSLSCMTARTADESDLFQIADIASLLLSDGVALLDVAQGKAMHGAQAESLSA